jgi:glycosyltransferase involved in cell wall biosynthesis
VSETRRVGFDVTPVISGATGIARYVTQVEASLRPLDVEVRAFAVGRSAFAVPPGTRHVRIPARLLVAWWGLGGRPYIEGLTGPVDLVHATGLLLPSTRRPLVLTVHDLAALRHAHLLPERHVRQQRAVIRRLPSAAAVVAVSKATAQDIVDLGVDAGRVVVAPLGVSRLPEPIPLPQTLRPLGQYLLTVGETAPRKDYPVLIRALARVRRDLELVMVGPPGRDEEPLRRLAIELGVDDRLRRLGAVSDGELAGLYRGALALCFPSVAEGFGLPVLEAMAEGTPALVSDLPVMREVAGPAAVYVEPAGVPEWAEAIETIASATTAREQLSEAGRRRASEFTWERTASATLDAYELALASGSPAGARRSVRGG